MSAATAEASSTAAHATSTASSGSIVNGIQAKANHGAYR